MAHCINQKLNAVEASAATSHMGVPSHRCTHTQGAAAGTPLFETIEKMMTVVLGFTARPQQHQQQHGSHGLRSGELEDHSCMSAAFELLCQEHGTCAICT